MRVIALSSDDKASMEVEFTDGATIVCHPNHEWFVFDRTKNSAYRNARFIYETKHMLERGLWMGERNSRGGRGRFQVDSGIRIAGRQVELPVPPYVLGVWLGDGTAEKNCITYSPSDIAIVKRIERTGIKRTTTNTHPQTGVRTDYFRDLYALLVENDLLGNKHIPPIYFTASLDQRLHLLAGLIDSDGYVYERNGRTVISSSDSNLVRDISRLIATFGWRVTQSWADPQLSSSGIQGKKAVCQITFSLDLRIPCALERKQTTHFDPVARRRSIKHIRQVKPVPGRCIQVESGIYLAGDTLVPTHNSELVSTRLPSFWLAHNPDLPVAMVSYAASLSYRNSRNARAVLQDPRFQFIFPGISLDPKNNRVEDWHLDRFRGYAMAVGVGGPITGHGFGLGLIDDPIENWAAAQSDTLRESIWQWWLGTFKTRLWEGASTIFMMCMPGETPVLMSDGTWRRLDTIRPGEMVKSYDNGELVNRQVEAFLPQGRKFVYEIKTGNHAIKATPNHPFLVEQKDGKRVWVRADKLEKGDQIVVLGQNGSGVNPRNLDEDDCWTLGFMFGDGWMGHNPRKDTGAMRWFTCVAIGEDDAPAKRVVEYINRKFSVRPRKTTGRYYRTDNARVGRWFESLGLIGDAHSKRIPELVFRLPVDLRRAFLDGLMEADGYTDDRHRGQINLTSKPLVEQVKLLAESCGYRTSNIYRHHGIYQPPGSPEPIEADSYNIQFQQNRIAQSQFETATIRSVRRINSVPVYDLTVADTHNFIAWGCVVHNTRWHEDDLAGRILDHEGTVKEGGKWEVLTYPALATEDDLLGRDVGEALAPSRFSRNWLIDFRNTSVEQVWQAEYQQRPIPPEGDFFKIGRIDIVNNVPAEVCRIIDGVPVNIKGGCRFWDLAGTEKKTAKRDPDSTSGTLVVEHEGYYYVLDNINVQYGPDQVEDLIKQTAKLDGTNVKVRIEQEPGQSGKAQIEYYVKLLAGFDVDGVPATGDKKVRAAGWAAQINHGNVYLLKGPWNKKWLAQHANFPHGTHDDDVDSSAGSFNEVTLGEEEWSRPDFAHL